MSSTERVWRKSIRSTSNTNCVELSVGEVWTGVRDSKNPEAGELSFATSAAFRAFLRDAKAGRHDLS